MSSHRAERRRVLGRALPADHSAGRDRALMPGPGRPTRRGRRGPARHKAVGRRGGGSLVYAVIGGMTLVAAGVGTLATASPSAHAKANPVRLAASQASLSAHWPGPGDGLYSRTAVELSRSGNRIPPMGVGVEESGPDEATESPAQERAEERASGRVAAQRMWALPTSHFYISTWFGERGWEWSSGYHTGIDFAAPCGTPEVAVTSGVVARAGWDGPYGYQVRLRLPNGDQVWYNHMIAIKTHVGVALSRGGLIGLMGETGNAYGCHLHLEYRVHGALKKPVDPAPYFAEHGIHLHALQARLQRSQRR